MPSPTETEQSSDGIAVVGMGCRLPGGVDGPAALWRLLAAGTDAVSEVPADRFDAAALHALRPGAPGRIASTRTGTIEGIELLDADAFGIAPREAALLDPQQRVLLETAFEALDDAGLRRDHLAGSATGVFVGAWLGDMEDRIFAVPEAVDFHATTGTGRYAMAGRLSYVLDLRGPSLSLDTACSSSLVAVHLAVQSLRRGESDLALAGGANVILEPSITVAYSQMGMLAPDGRCKFGDESADGYVRSDGAAVVVLKRLAEAIADDDRIYAVIRGSAVTNDGRSGDQFVSPGPAGQEDVLRRAYADAGIDPAVVGYVEAHGTGTAVGDPVELGALGAVVGARRPVGDPCLVGSLKSNVGHTEGAAGAAGLIKAALVLHHGEVPATIHVHRPNPSVPWADLGLALSTEGRSWAGDGARFAGVSGFGISGTNAHVVLESAPAPPARAERSAPEGPHLLAISARSDDARRALAGRYRELLETSGADLAAVAAAAASRRTPMRDRLAIVASSGAGAALSLAAFEAGETRQGVISGRARPEVPRVVFVFPGQGSQWVGMGRDLIAADPVFASTFGAVSAAVEAEAGWSPVALLSGVPDDDRLGDVDVVQPLIFAVQVALAARWRAWGVEPAAVIGHSMGEVAAAHVVGALDLHDAVAVICRRSRLLRRIAGAGAMAVVDLPAAEVETVLDGRPDVSVAVSNSPRSTVIGGVPAAVEALIEQFTTADVFARRVQVDVASHTPQVEPLLADLDAALSDLTPRVPRLTFASTVDGGLADGGLLDAAYWSRNLRSPVRFGDAVAGQFDDGATVFLEISPHPVLQPVVAEMVAGGDTLPGALAAASLRRGEPGREALLANLARLWVDGVDVDWVAVLGPGRADVDLPAYPWQRRRHWHDRPVRSAATGGHPLLGHRVAPSATGSAAWELVPGVGPTAYLLDHVVRTAALLPAAGTVEMFAAAAAELAPMPGGLSVVGLRLVEPLPLDGRRVQVVLDPDGPDRWRGRVLAAVPDDDGAPWQLHAEAVVERAGPGAASDAADAPPLALLDGSEGDHHAAMVRRGLAYGPRFDTVRAVRPAGAGTVALVGAVDAVEAHERTIRILDGAFQAALAALPPSTAMRTFVPVGADRIDLLGEPSDEVVVLVTALVPGEQWTADLQLVTTDGCPVAVIAGLRLQPLRSSPRELEHEVVWRPAPPLDVTGADEIDVWIVYAADDDTEALAEGLRASGARCTIVTPAAGAAEAIRTGVDRWTIASGDEDGHRRVLADAREGGGRTGIVHGWAAALDADAVPGEVEAAAAAPVALLHALDAEADVRLWFVTSGAQAVGDGPVHPAQAVLWGLGRVVATERPALRCTLVDVDPAGTDSETVVAELRAGQEPQVALRGGVRHVARLVAAGPPRPRPRQPVLADVHRLAPTTPGSLEGLRPVAAPRRTPGPDEVEIRVEAAALNFIDVLKAMGDYPGLEPSPDVALGAEGAGRVVTVGADVEGLAVGDEVVAITSSYEGTGLLASHVTVPAAFVRRRPVGLDAASACALPVAHVTALIALRDLARVRAGDRVLVHSATGGVGLAALALCRASGAEVLATAGTEAKRDLLRSLGIEHVFDSRTTAFADGVLRATDGVGVDVVLNSLAGDAIPAGLSALAPGGRFVEIGKRDVHAHALLDLGALRRNLSFHVLDLAGLTSEAPDLVAAAFGDVVAMVADGRLAPLPVTVAPLADAAAVFRTMAGARHTGKLVLTIPDEPVVVEGSAIRPDRTYLVTGGLGALGLAVAGRLVERGARHLALLGRSAPGPEAAAVVNGLRAQGAEVRTVTADVADAGAVEGALDDLRATMPPLVGVVHAAGVLADATLDRMDGDRLHEALAPKQLGAWHLHRATADDDLDHFVLVSSVAGILGLAGQANYAAGNAYLDVLAHQRRAEGRPAMAIAFGPWVEVGLAAVDADRGERLAGRGLGGLGTVEGLDAFERALDDARADLVVMRFDAVRWAEAEPAATALISELLVTGATAGHRPGRDLSTLVDRLAGEPPAVRRRLLEELVGDDVATVLNLVAGRVDRAEPLKEMGLDSLMALELRNRLEAATGLTLSATMAFNYPTVADLAEHLADRLGDPLSAATEAGAAAVAPAVLSLVTPDLDDEIATAADDDLAALLGEELSAIDRLLGSEEAT